MKLLLLICALVLPLVATAQRTYTIMLWNSNILDLRVPVRNGMGLYRNGGQQYGGGKIVISKSNFSITLQRGAARPDVVKPITRIEATTDKTTYHSGTSRLVVFKSELDTDQMVSRQQIQYDDDWEATVKLHVRRTLFITTTTLTATERVAAEKMRQSALVSARAAQKAELEEQIKNGYVFPSSDLSTCYHFTGEPQDLLAFYTNTKATHFSALLMIDETGAVVVKNPSYAGYNESTLETLLKFRPGRIAVGRDTFSVKSSTTMVFSATKTSSPETMVASFIVKKKGIRLEVTSTAAPELQSKVKGMVNFEWLLAERPNGEYELQYLEQKVMAQITVRGSNDNDCGEFIPIAAREVSKPILKYRRLEGYDTWRTVQK
ncbi:hypothetical protein LRS06_21810 [Hymenobacter sp. J193]|uniref:hypothetical protein n=1 Tax=Hymenobacter sp. J193 TaxID=2898429 RepID=UPI002151470B|nr:hypothetical protein [Hymenobacter sp. J193]MCR5890367.1 hypothetical protein [Hymenobacter sp. J193]